MSGLYNVVLGRHPLASELLGMLGFTSEEDVSQIPRLRDLYLYPEEIRILTRTGGGNRGDYESENEWMETIPGYLRNWDDDYDSTFAWWAYSWPEEWREQLQTVLVVLQERRPDLIPESNSIRERWDASIKNIGKQGN